jgi:hypothetical protein
VEFLGIVPTSADDIAAARAEADSAGGQSERQKIDEAADFLGELCASGPVDRRDVERYGKTNGFSMRTLDRARQRADILTRSLGFGKEKRSEWYRADDRSGPPIPANAYGESTELNPNTANPANPANGTYIDGHGAIGANGHPPELRLRMTAHGLQPFDGDRPVPTIPGQGDP